MVDGRREMERPFKENVEMLPDNYGLAAGQARSLGKRFPMDQKRQNGYFDVIDQPLKLGTIEEVNGIHKQKESLRHIPRLPLVQECPHFLYSIQEIRLRSVKASNFSFNRTSHSEAKQSTVSFGYLKWRGPDFV